MREININLSRIIILTLLLLVSCNIKHVSNQTIAPIKGIERLKNTPMSTLDFFLYRLYDNTSCRIWYGANPNLQPQICMGSYPTYSEDNNTIKLEYHFSLYTNDESDMEYLESFKQSSMTEKKRMVKQTFNHLLYKLGLEYKRYYITSPKLFLGKGLIDEILSSLGIDEISINAIKTDIKISAKFFYDEDLVITANRDEKGKINIKIEKSEIIAI